MVDAEPLNGDTPYEVLGADETDTVEGIKQDADEAFDHYVNLRAEGKQEDDDEKIERALNALEEIEDAWEWVQEHHEPPIHDGPASIEVLTADPRVGSPVEVEVTGSEEPIETPVEASSDAEGTASDRTDSDGRTSFTFSKHDVVQFTVPTTDPYDDAVEVVTVERKQVDLSFDGVPAMAEIGDDVTVTVMGDGTPEPDVEIEVESARLGTTGPNGSLTHSFDTTGEYTVTGSKQDDAEATYSNCETQIEVAPTTVDLELTIEGSDFEYGDEITVRVHEADSPQPVEGATVSIGDASESTNKKGVAKLELPDVGSVTVEAEKQGSGDKNYGRAGKTVSVAKRDRNLQISDVSGPQMEGSEITIEVVDDNGDYLEDASVSTNWGHTKETDGDGETTLSLDRKGRLEITAEKDNELEEFGNDVRRVDIEEFTRELDIDISDTLPDPGDTITVTVTDTEKNPVQGATVTCNKQIGTEWTTDSNGEAEIQLLNQVGNRRLTIKKEDSDFDSESRTVRVL